MPLSPLPANSDSPLASRIVHGMAVITATITLITLVINSGPAIGYDGRSGVITASSTPETKAMVARLIVASADSECEAGALPVATRPSPSRTIASFKERDALAQGVSDEDRD